MTQETNPLDQFLFQIIKECKGKILDYGCGQGRFIDYCHKRGLKIYGADSFEGIYQSWESQSNSILRIHDNVVPVKNKSFEVVITNQVLEHIHPDAILDVSKEIRRLIANDGFSLHIFPTKKTLIEPHVGILGAHWLKNGSSIQRRYLQIGFKLGFGYWRSEAKRDHCATKTNSVWVEESCNALQNHCFFVSLKDWRKAMQQNGLRVERVGYSLFIHALPISIKPHLEFLSRFRIVKLVLNELVSLKLGEILRIKI
jgi:SAM-dependent methyltransferase